MLGYLVFNKLLLSYRVYSFDDPDGLSNAFVLFLKFLTSCRTPRSNITSSDPPGIRTPGTSRYIPNVLSAGYQVENTQGPTLDQLSLSTLRIPIPTKQQLSTLRTLIQHNATLRLDHRCQATKFDIRSRLW